MSNHYIVSINLNKLCSQNNKINISLNDLITSYYNINMYNFDVEIEKYKSYMAKRFNIMQGDLILLDKYKLINQFLNNEDKYLEYNKGIILFDASMLNDGSIISNIDFLFSNFEEVTLNKMYDNYLIYFYNKLTPPKNTSKQTIMSLNNNILEIITNDLIELELLQKIKNIPNIIKNEKLTNKISNDLSYITNIKDEIYTNFYKNNEVVNNNKLSSYESDLFVECKIRNTLIKYCLTNKVNKINNIQEILSKLYEYNKYISDISSKIINNDEQKNMFELNDLFDHHKLEQMYSNIENNKEIIFEMNNMFDTTFKISYNEINEHISYESFINNVVFFLNELVKRKIIKLIKTYNFSRNEINIKNKFSHKN